MLQSNKKSEPTIAAKNGLVNGDGTQRKYFALTDINCLTCNPYNVDEERVYAVLNTIESTVALECLRCGDSRCIGQAELEGRQAAAAAGIELPHPFRR